IGKPLTAHSPQAIHIPRNKLIHILTFSAKITLFPHNSPARVQKPRKTVRGPLHFRGTAYTLGPKLHSLSSSPALKINSKPLKNRQTFKEKEKLEKSFLKSSDILTGPS
ncbi:MAG: hypothetical protein IKY36_00390, partial [Bacteroidales bacterium]|nr:hypothetical protein [Bacteroidales bacterium]